MSFPTSTCRTVALAVSIALAALGCDQASDPFVGPDDEPSGIEMSRLTNQTLSQSDHFGLPAINTVFVPSGKKDRYNRLAPSPSITAEARGYISGFLNDVAALRENPLFTPQQLAGVLYPDVQPLDFPDAVLATGEPLSGFPDGRDFDDDVIDTELFLIFGENADLNSDGVDANDKPRLAQFPYLPGPHVSGS